MADVGVNQQLGDFEIVRELGRGGMGIVYEARQVSLNRRVALKVLATGLGLTAKAVHRFQREAEAAAKLHHTNIVPVYATGEEAGLHYYAMELIEGSSLDFVIRQLRDVRQPTIIDPQKPETIKADQPTGPYADASWLSASAGGSSSAVSSTTSSYFDNIATKLADVADALGHAHRNGVIHRDIKPSNLLLASTGRLSVNDFGLARMLEQPGVTVTGEFVGTPRYMSPEQIAGGRVLVDHRTDIYSLGATLYELLTLQPPFSGEHREQLLAQILQKEPLPPNKLNKKVPLDLETICLKALEKDPDRRYQSAGAMADDLRRYVSRFAILARRAGPVAKTIKWVRRHPALSAALAAMVVALGIAGILAYRIHLGEKARFAERAEHERQLLEERRRAALDKALLAVRQDDFQLAEEAIREAERLECSAGQIRMMRGQVALFQGQDKEALAHLQQAVQLMPQSVAAHSLLAVAYEEVGIYPKWHESLAEAMRLPAVTPEDLLFRGLAESTLDSDRALRTLEEAVQRRPTAVARLIRVEALRKNLTNNPRLDEAELAMEDIRFIKRELQDNVRVLTISLAVHLTCYHIFDEFKKPVLRQTALEEGRKDCRALERFPHLPNAVLMRAMFLDETGDGDPALPELLKIAESTNHTGALSTYAGFMYRRGEFEKTEKLLVRSKGVTVMDIMRGFILAELPDGPKRAGALYAEIAARDLKDWDLLNSQYLLRFLGRKQESVEICRRFLRQPEWFPPVRREQFQRAVEYCAGQRSAQELLDSLRGSRGDLVYAHFAVALTALADGDRLEAKKHFQLSVRTHLVDFFPYDLSVMFLTRMENDPEWPRWIGPQAKKK